MTVTSCECDLLPWKRRKVKKKKVLTLPNASKTESKYSNTPKSRKKIPKPDKPTPISAVMLVNRKNKYLNYTFFLVFFFSMLFPVDVSKAMVYGMRSRALETESNADLYNLFKALKKTNFLN